MKRRWLAAGAVLLVVLWLTAAFYPYYVIEIPEGYTGPVVIFFDHPNGTQPGIHRPAI
ncbi:MAG TPA: hypothetical protein VFH73_05045 [Polyangia bacterium]|jgi:hypothetical protein|nr:hypothetical protein [Polyangia bacterium]